MDYKDIEKGITFLTYEMGSNIKVGIVSGESSFNDLASVAIENDSVVDLDFVLSQLKLFELCDSMMVVDPRDTNKIVQKIYKKYDKE